MFNINRRGECASERQFHDRIIMKYLMPLSYFARAEIKNLISFDGKTFIIHKTNFTNELRSQQMKRSDEPLMFFSIHVDGSRCFNFHNV